MNFSTNRVQMSSKHSYFCFNIYDEKLLLRTAECFGKPSNLLSFDDTGFDAEVSGKCISFNSDNAKFSCAFYDKFYLVFKGEGTLKFRFVESNGYKAHTAIEQNGCIRFYDPQTHTYIWLVSRSGKLSLSCEWKAGRIHSGETAVIAESAETDFEFVLFKTAALGEAEISCPSFEECCALKEKDFADYCEKMDAKTPFRKEMAFVLWANTVAPLGNYKNDTILCAKAGMNAVWSWDNAFHALGIAKAFPETSFYQFELIYENMDEEGALPDLVTPFEVVRGFTKPPIHAFIYSILMELNPFFSKKTQIEKIYPFMAKNFNWWLSARKDAPIYWHGNDSGSDNSTCFDRYPLVKSPDLYAFLCLEAKLLNEFALILGDNESAKIYEDKMLELGKEIEKNFFDGEKLFVIPTDTYKPFETDSIMPYRALIAAQFSSENLIEKTAARIEKEFLLEYGLATEAVSSEKYIEGDYESYWRGSSWSTENFIVAKGLEYCGKTELANKILDNYRKALMKGGAAENSNARTGKGNCCAAYSWSAAMEFSSL